ncbi:MAG TPA: DUF1802 family protein [Gemmatimonadaceae bacterium]
MVGTAPLVSDPERTALKEWAVLVDAMARGDLVAMVRKGGIREQRKGFAVRHDRFLFYPTWFHEKAAELAPRFREALQSSHANRPPDGVVRIAHVAEAAAVWAVSSLDTLRAIEGAHGLDWSAVESRFSYRGRPGVQVVAVRVRRLPRVVELPEARRYGGCVSWVELDRDVNVAGAEPALDDATFAARLDSLRAALGEPSPREP